MKLKNGNLTIDKDLDFYFWINVYGVCSFNIDPRQLTLFNFYSPKYLEANPKTVNGFKIMNDEKEMMDWILPKIDNN
jgi:hypothetical protein